MDFGEIRAFAAGEINPRIEAINERLYAVEFRVAKYEVLVKEKIAMALAATVGEIEKILTTKFDDASIRISEEEFREILGAAMREMR